MCCSDVLLIVSLNTDDSSDMALNMWLGYSDMLLIVSLNADDRSYSLTATGAVQVLPRATT